MHRIAYLAFFLSGFAALLYQTIWQRILAFFGGADWRASAAETLVFAQKLQQAGKSYELVIYADDDHSLSLNKDDSYRRIVNWFRKHMR